LLRDNYGILDKEDNFKGSKDLTSHRLQLRECPQIMDPEGHIRNLLKREIMGQEEIMLPDQIWLETNIDLE
jgi:hypothetical protein